jgi:hypothetical protein
MPHALWMQCRVMSSRLRIVQVASGAPEHTHAVAAAIPALVRLTGSAKNNVREQAIWTLGNIAGDSVAMRGMPGVHPFAVHMPVW